MTVVEQSQDVGGVPLRLVRGGRGSKVLFLHGAAGFQGWLPFFDGLSGSHEVIATEHPGFGLSHAQDWADSVGKLADFYVGLLKRPDFGPAHLVGSSLGGWLAAEIAVRDASALTSLTLIAPAGIRSPDVVLPDSLAWSYEELMRKVFASPAIADQVLAQPLSDAQVQLRARNRTAIERLGRDGFFNPDFPAPLKRLRIPVTIVWGDDDQVVPTAYAPLWADGIPHASLTVLPECGHLPHVEKRAATTALLLSRMQEAES